MLIILFKSLQHMNKTEQVCNGSTHLHDDALIGHARQRHDLIGCRETRTVGAQSVGVYADTRVQGKW